MKPSGPPRGVRSPSFTLRGKILSDKRIDFYARKGFYGPVAQANALALIRKKPKKKKTSLSSTIKMLERL